MLISRRPQLLLPLASWGVICLASRATLVIYFCGGKNVNRRRSLSLKDEGPAKQSHFKNWLFFIIVTRCWRYNTSTPEDKANIYNNALLLLNMLVDDYFNCSRIVTCLKESLDFDKLLNIYLVLFYSESKHMLHMTYYWFGHFVSRDRVHGAEWEKPPLKLIDF